jgi:hypothetical protein
LQASRLADADADVLAAAPALKTPLGAVAGCSGQPCVALWCWLLHAEIGTFNEGRHPLGEMQIMKKQLIQDDTDSAHFHILLKLLEYTPHSDPYRIWTNTSTFLPPKGAKYEAPKILFRWC